MPDKQPEISLAGPWFAGKRQVLDARNNLVALVNLAISMDEADQLVKYIVLLPQLRTAAQAVIDKLNAGMSMAKELDEMEEILDRMPI